ncbi:enoyl-CoA hydratase-related protein [Rhodococcus sp. NPDC004095]
MPVLETLERVRVPTLAVIDGACAGSGLLLAAACDVRIPTPASSFGLPTARTGQCNVHISSCPTRRPNRILAAHVHGGASTDARCH